MKHSCVDFVIVPVLFPCVKDLVSTQKKAIVSVFSIRFIVVMPTRFCSFSVVFPLRKLLPVVLGIDICTFLVVSSRYLSFIIMRH